MRKSILSLLVMVVAVTASRAQQSPEWNSAQIKLHLEKLDVLGNVLYIAAHPDDENTGLLAYLSNGKKYRTGYLALTRGDGGQNLVGDEQGSDLGLMRTEELLAARHIDGAEQFFSRANDFGFSKTATETFRFWGHERILRDAVWIVRKFRPDVIICRFPEDKRAGHGHHWASAIIAHEAFIAAADPKRFPEQLAYVRPWQAKRILWNTYNFGGRNTTAPDQLRIQTGGYNALLGEGYGELAARSRSMNRTQGFGVSKSYGEHWEYFKTIAGSKPEKTLMDGVETGWSRLADGADVGRLVAHALASYDCDHPAALVPQLLKIRSAITAVRDTFWRAEKLREVDQLIFACCGLWMDAFSTRPYVVAGGSVDIHTSVIARGGVPVTLKSVEVAGAHQTVETKLSDNVLHEATHEVTVAGSTPISEPYWLIRNHPVGYYEIPSQMLVGVPRTPPALTATFQLEIAGTTLEATYPVAYKHTDPVLGEMHNPLVVAPPVTANVENEVYVFTSTEPRTIRVKLRAFTGGIQGTAHLADSGRFTVENNDQPFTLADAGDEKTLAFTVKPSGSGWTGTETATVKLEVGGKTYTRGIRVIAPGYIPTITEFPRAETRLVDVPMEVKPFTVGYVVGAGDKVPQALEQLGYTVKLLSDEDLSAADLSSYGAIVVGVRAYNTRARLKYATPRLMDYVRGGGTLVVQYNKNFGLVTDKLGPYPFKVENLRVTEEDAPVKFLLPGDPVLNTPNKITEKDFEGWIQERGIYFVDQVDARYRQPLSMHDTGEAPLDGSLIVTRYGKGRYVYTGLDFFRELPAGVAGAYRLFVNLLEQ
jgi:LmbE family N-acetylglucosaminyl deacetylase